MLNLKDKKFLITGGFGFLGSSINEKLLKKGVPQSSIYRPRKMELDLRKIEDCQKAVKGVDVVIHLAANFDGLKYNTEHAAEVFYDNAAMGVSLIEASHKAGVKKFVLAGTVGSYPKTAKTPFSEKEYWNGLPEQGNDSYGLSKKFVAAQLMSYRQQFGFVGINLVLANLYGPGDHFELVKANVIPALIYKFTKAKKENLPEVVMWGSGNATREFLFVDDAAEAFILATQKYDGLEPINIGSGREDKIKLLAVNIAKLIGYKGKIVWDKTKPEGQKRRVSNVKMAELACGFKAKTSLVAGLKKTYQWYKENIDTF